MYMYIVCLVCLSVCLSVWVDLPPACIMYVRTYLGLKNREIVLTAS